MYTCGGGLLNMSCGCAQVKCDFADTELPATCHYVEMVKMCERDALQGCLRDVDV